MTQHAAKKQGSTACRTVHVAPKHLAATLAANVQQAKEEGREQWHEREPKKP